MLLMPLISFFKLKYGVLCVSFGTLVLGGGVVAIIICIALGCGRSHSNSLRGFLNKIGWSNLR